MDFIENLKRIAQENGGIIDNKTAAEHGVSRAMLSKLCSKHQIQRIARGQYILEDDVQDELLSVALRTQWLIFSHETALFLHGFSDRTPFVHTITVPSDKIPSKSMQEDCKIYYIKPKLFELGKTILKTPAGNEVAGYDLERTICDIIRSRSRVGDETFLFALKKYVGSSQKDLTKLYVYAKRLGVAGVLRRYLEVLL